MGDTSVELWLDRHRFSALEQEMEVQGTSLEKHLQNYLIDLYTEQVPPESQREVEKQIVEEKLREEQRARESRRFAVFRITENGAVHCFECDDCLELMQLALLVRRYQRGELKRQLECFAALFQNTVPVSDAQFEENVKARMDNTGQITGVFDINFDRQVLSGVHIMDGWKTYSMKDTGAAAYHAYRADYLPRDKRWGIFLEHLAGKEITEPSQSAEEHSRRLSEAENLTGQMTQQM
ncbi:hypothetical protein [Caproicibacter fermentans]|uniref:Uncharacterized protein n=1 Tax=Caproicibacter fermentans TaxID=2576756 RepID=A0A7G8T8R0_9FIRM|nr:hypothetical protein [Caproicibacter fermentans]QNK40001.1 hypothetical protein HCR03_15010 [Caproicibacter fermentans]